MRKSNPSYRSATGFTLVEVMMAAIILTVGFMGLIQAVTICSGMMDQARRQTLAAEILNHEIESLRLADWSTISSLPTAQIPLGGPWNASSTYSFGDSATYGGNWYRCVSTNSGQAPTSTSYWKLDIPPYGSVISVDGIAYGATFILNRTTADVIGGSLREVTFTITWFVTTSRKDDDGNPVTFTYTRVNSAYFGKYGLNLSYQRS